MLVALTQCTGIEYDTCPKHQLAPYTLYSEVNSASKI